MIICWCCLIFWKFFGYVCVFSGSVVVIIWLLVVWIFVWMSVVWRFMSIMLILFFVILKWVWFLNVGWSRVIKVMVLIWWKGWLMNWLVSGNIVVYVCLFILCRIKILRKIIMCSLWSRCCIRWVLKCVFCVDWMNWVGMLLGNWLMGKGDWLIVCGKSGCGKLCLIRFVKLVIVSLLWC